jgi:hypothetical protein
MGTRSCSYARRVKPYRTETATVRELEDWRMTLHLTIASLEIEEQPGGGLLKEYEHMRQGHDQ